MSRKWSKLWSEDIRRVFERKKESFLVWKRTRSKEDLKEYMRMKRVVKRRVREEKKRLNEEWILNLAESFKDNKKNF